MTSLNNPHKSQEDKPEEALPVYLIMGLLGSGKTTLLKNLIQQKPEDENWMVLINEFGEIDIDSNLIQAQLGVQKDSVIIEPVKGGCICCGTHLTLTKTLNKVYQNPKMIHRLFIELTGLGHPMSITDVLKTAKFTHPIKLVNSVCVISPVQLTPTRWEKSKVMRDLVTLADTVILNKIDLSSEAEIEDSKNIIENLYPAKTKVIETHYSELEVEQLLEAPKPDPLGPLGGFLFVKPVGEDATKNKPDHTPDTQAPYNSKIVSTLECFTSYSSENEFTGMGWRWSDETQFNRVKLTAIFKELSPALSRAKGILKTGKEWQLVQWADQQLSFEDIAWRADSRLECFFDPLSDSGSALTTESVENIIESAIHKYNH